MNKERVLQVIDNLKGSLETMDYGKWGALNVEQRNFIRALCSSWLILDEATNKQTEEIERLKNINEEHRILNGEIRKELEVEKDISDGMLKTIDKAIEYIEIIQHNESYGVKEKDYLKLLDILKGEDKE